MLYLKTGIDISPFIYLFFSLPQRPSCPLGIMERDLWRASVSGKMKNMVEQNTLVTTRFLVPGMTPLLWMLLFLSPGMGRSVLSVLIQPV